MYYSTTIKWLNSLFPNGIDSRESILISGPGGSGKPLVELAFVYAWLENGGSVIGIPLQYPTLEMVSHSMNDIYHMNLNDYKDHVAYISFNPELQDELIIDHNIVHANIIRHGIWNKAIEQAISLVKPNELGVLVFGSALNLLLFNDHYRDDMVKLITHILSKRTSYTSLFTVSNNVFSADIKKLEDAVDNLMETMLDDEMILTLHMKRIKSMNHTKNQIIIPIGPETLNEIESLARSTRNKNIQNIKMIK
jgi:KaiC/GvpD/RAD55 family RecA-like ATPase